MPYLFQVSLGPVQSFIKEARRTRDLKFNSWFLGEIARVAALTISQYPGQPELIFPALSTEELKRPEAALNVPNKIFVYIDADPQPLADEVKKAIDNRVDKLRKQTFSAEDLNRQIDKGRAEKQIADLVEYLWVALAYDEREDSPTYAQARQALEGLLAARKNTRDFGLVTWGQPCPKSSLDGRLEGVINKNAYPDLARIEKKSLAERKRIYEQVKRFRETFGAGSHEILSGVDLLKRLGSIGDGARTFPSTSHMAALPFLTGLARLEAKERKKAEDWKTDYLKALTEAKDQVQCEFDRLPKSYWNPPYWPDTFLLDEYDGALLYPERFPDVVGDTEVYKDKDARQPFREAERILEDFCKEIKMRPGPYYALLVADGDAMGVCIDAQAKKGMDQHLAFSRALAQFANGVAKTIQDHAGVCIYAGGDDVLALLPLHRAMQCAQKLALDFKDALDPFKNEAGGSPTLSAGLAIVHHLHPLGLALDIARAAETRAKKKLGKNALAITLQKRGGPPCEVGGHWGAFDTRLEEQIRLCQQGIIPAGMAYELEEVALRLEPEVEQSHAILTSAPYVQYAALRVLQRKLDEAKRAGHSAEEADTTLAQLKEMIGLDQTPAVRVGTLADELVVARFFADARSLASGRSEGGVQA